MREALSPYTQANRLNYLCLIADQLLGIQDLNVIPSLMSGFESVLKTLSPDIVQAITNLRHNGIAPTTKRELMLLVDNYKNHHDVIERKKAAGDQEANVAIERRYKINQDLSIEPRWTHLVPEDVKEALSSLSNPLPVKQKPRMDIHDALIKAEVTSRKAYSNDEKAQLKGYSANINPLGFLPPEPPLYPANRIGRAPGKVLWSDLIKTAQEFDETEVAKGYQSKGGGHWFNRLHDAAGDPAVQLLGADPKAGLLPADEIDLTGLKHLIGLPGSGKTTILYLLAGYLFKSGNTACFLFPSIEVATGFIERLNQLDIPVGLLSGQGSTAKRKHVLNYATSLSSTNRGFGVSNSNASFFSTNCALAGYASDEEEEFPHENPPCQTILQRQENNKRSRKYQCALSSVCGYQFGERFLGQTQLWAGHILSMDRGTSNLFSEEKIRHFEFIARTFDLLVIDECDGAQTNLDSRGTPVMKLVGDSESLWSTLIQEIHQPAAHGRNAFMAGESLPVLLEMTGRFGRAAERLMGRVIHFKPGFKETNENKLHTAISLIGELFADEKDPDQETRLNARKGLELLWDMAAKRIAFRQSPNLDIDETEEYGANEATNAPDDKNDEILNNAANLLGTSRSEIDGFYAELISALEIWERDGNDQSVLVLAKVLRSVPNLTSPLDDEKFFDYSGFLVAVSMVVLQHFGLAPHLRLLNSEGLVSESVFISSSSRDMKAALPESLVGRLNGIRYSKGGEGDIEISHVSFSGTPRVLPHRMTKIGLDRANGGTAVLLTSATSLLGSSPSFHVDTGPHYVLKRPYAGEGWKHSQYRFNPVNDPHNNEKYLRFSGAPLHLRDQVLTDMVDQLLKYGENSEVSYAIKTNNIVEEVPRKAAFIVNSYDQCLLLYKHIIANHAYWRGRVRYLVRSDIHGEANNDALTAAEVEKLGYDNNWDLLVFPMNAIGRGVNIVYQFGARKNHAMVGSLFFLTRPHPRGDSLQLIQGLVGQSSEKFDKTSFPDLRSALDGLTHARRETVRLVEGLLRLPLVSSRLGEYGKPFTADQMIIILQTIGRAMRGDCPAFVYFVDAAWAPARVKGEIDTPKTSMLVMMQSILKECLDHSDPVFKGCYENLYKAFYEPMSNIDNLLPMDDD